MGVISLAARRETQEYVVLNALATGPEPLGAGAMAEALRQAGEMASEATVGRLLKDLDTRGYTRRDGFRGRTLTAAGQFRLQELELDRDRTSKGEELIKRLKARGRDELVEVLVARRAIERETARLAALQATPRDIEYLMSIVKRHEEHSRAGVAAEDDTAFHRYIAQLSGNRVLEAAFDLIRQDGQLSPVLEHIRKEVKSSVATDHRRIVEALGKKDSAAAEHAMVHHIENVIEDVERYWDLAERRERD